MSVACIKLPNKTSQHSEGIYSRVLLVGSHCMLSLVFYLKKTNFLSNKKNVSVLLSDMHAHNQVCSCNFITIYLPQQHSLTLSSQCILLNFCIEQCTERMCTEGDQGWKTITIEFLSYCIVGKNKNYSQIQKSSWLPNPRGDQGECVALIFPQLSILIS